MSGVRVVVSSDRTLATAHAFIDEEYSKHKYGTVTFTGGKRTLDQNALAAVWYLDIAKHRGDCNAIEIKNECKYLYGVTILRREAGNNWLYERTIDLMDYEKSVKAMSRFAVTSIMTVKEKTEYLEMMQQDHPFLTSEG